MNNEQLKASILAFHADVVSRARLIYRDFAAAPSIQVYFYDKGRTAGKANGSLKISYNLHVFAQDPTRFMNDTIPHEIAHAVCSFTGIDRGHGRNWKAVCRRLGGNGKRCFDGSEVDIKAGRKTTKYNYTATCGTIVPVSGILHKKIQLQSKAYKVRATGGRFSKLDYSGIAA
jgi:predicted SprT family Zn-dependent metalloprotease